jgi:hypothetical protein
MLVANNFVVNVQTTLCLLLMKSVSFNLNFVYNKFVVLLVEV